MVCQSCDQKMGCFVCKHVNKQDESARDNGQKERPQ